MINLLKLHICIIDNECLAKNLIFKTYTETKIDDFFSYENDLFLFRILDRYLKQKYLEKFSTLREIYFTIYKTGKIE